VAGISDADIVRLDAKLRDMPPATDQYAAA
jgi:hypothetical protein